MNREYILLILIVLIYGCSSSDRIDSELFSSFREIGSPASSNSGQPYLFSSSDGKIYMSWIEPGNEKKHAFRFAVFNGKGWGEQRTIIEGNDFFVNWADVPSIFQSDDEQLAAHWLESSGEWIFSYDVRMSLSDNGGLTWSEPVTPHRDGTQTEHGFASIFNYSGDGIGIVWLDGREAELYGSAGDSHGHGGDWNMHLRSAVIYPDGILFDEVVLDEMVCECCPTAAAETEDGILVAYRNRTEDEIRDIYLVRYTDGRWSAPYPVHNDNWNIPGCPVNGPALSAIGNRVTAAWYTAADNDSRVNIAFSRDGGRSFGSPYRIDDGIPLGRPAVDLLDDRSALVMWVEVTEENAGVMVRRIFPDGAMGRVEKIAAISDDRSSGYPRMARSGDNIVFAWIDSFDERIVKTAVAILRD
jgi:hypothetical protein